MKKLQQFLILATISLASAESSKLVACSYFSNSNWKTLNAIVKTCWLSNQVIYSEDFLVANPRDLGVKGLSVQHNSNFEFLPDGLENKFPNLIGIEVYNCSLRAIRERHLKGLYQLKRLSLFKNGIKEIDSRAFIDLSKLTYLDLSFNQIEFLTADTFSSLVNLQYLRLRNNSIAFVHSRTFATLFQVEDLDVRENFIDYIYENTFENLINLKNISLNNNILVNIDDVLFANNRKLERIWLHNNSLEFIQPNMFDGLPKLILVNLKENTCVNKAFWSTDFTELSNVLKENCTTISQLLENKRTALDLLKLEMKRQQNSCDKEKQDLRISCKLCNSPQSTPSPSECDVRSDELTKKLEACYSTNNTSVDVLLGCKSDRLVLKQEIEDKNLKLKICEKILQGEDESNKI